MTSLLSENGLLAAEDLYYMLDGGEKIRVLDATYGAVRGLSPFDAYLGRHIEGAQFFDIDAVADQEASLPHTLPSPEYFASCAEAMGISNGDHVVIYDQSGGYIASTRAWWMFRAFGHEQVYVLDGGLGAWVGRGFKTVAGPEDAPASGTFTAKFNTKLVTDRDALIRNIDTKKMAVIDARPAERFHGNAPEPRPSMRPGHIPGSLNIPFGALLDPMTGRFKDDADLESIFEAMKIAREREVAVSCGSGVTACTVAFALFKARAQDAAVYDGSWSEWGKEDAGTPVEVSA